MRKIIGIVSGKGGVGKTTATINLGLAMHKLGENVVVVDGDLRNPNLGLHLGSIENYLTLHDAIEKEIPVLEALHIHETGLRFIPAHLSLSFLNTDPSKMREALRAFDCYVLLDAPSGLEKGALAVMEACDEAVFVTSPYLPDVTDCMKTIEVARSMNITVKGIVLNNVRYKKNELKPEEIEAVTNTKIIQQIPWDKRVLECLSNKVPVIEKYPSSGVGTAFFNLAADLCDREYKKPKIGGLKRLLSRNK